MSHGNSDPVAAGAGAGAGGAASDVPPAQFRSPALQRSHVMLMTSMYDVDMKVHAGMSPHAIITSVGEDAHGTIRVLHSTRHSLVHSSGEPHAGSYVGAVPPAPCPEKGWAAAEPEIPRMANTVATETYNWMVVILLSCCQWSDFSVSAPCQIRRFRPGFWRRTALT